MSDKEKKELYCPISFARNSATYKCCKEDCAWWVTESWPNGEGGVDSSSECVITNLIGKLESLQQ